MSIILTSLTSLFIYYFILYSFPTVTLLFCFLTNVPFHQGFMCIDIYMYLHMHMHISTHKLIKTINILLFTASCFTNTISLPKDLFVHLCILCLFCSGMFFSLCFGVDIVLVLAWLLFLFFFFREEENKHIQNYFSAGYKVY